MTVDEIQTPVVAGPALPLADHAAILPELAEWARGQMADGPLDFHRDPAMTNQHLMLLNVFDSCEVATVAAEARAAPGAAALSRRSPA